MLNLCCFVLLSHQAEVTLPKLFTDSMVLQRDRAIPIWGTAPAGSRVSVELQANRGSATADQAGRWRVDLPALPAGGPYALKVNGQTRARDIMIGEVWLASGQSNMEWPVIAANDYQREAREADRRVRMFTVRKASLDAPATDANGTWERADAYSVGSFSAIGYAFARNLAEKLNVTVGVIHASWGGSPAEAWTSRRALTSQPKLRYLVDSYQASRSEYPAKKAAYDRNLIDWRRKVFLADTGNEGFEKGLASPIRDDSDWTPVTLPSLIAPGPDGPFNGAVWVRRTVDVPQSWVGTPLVLELGVIDEFDETYFNGHKVGETDRRNEDSWREPRLYRIAPGLYHAGPNTIAVRIFDQAGPGGTLGPAGTMRLRRGGTIDDAIPLAGDWKQQIERAVPEPSAEVMAEEPARPFGPGNPAIPGGLYNGMIAPLVPYGIRGAIWYQGEANAERATQYADLFPTLVRDWRALWNPDLPFYFVQLPNYKERVEEPSDGTWPELREAQLKSLRALRNTGMAVTIDLGEAGTIHPREKGEVGRRLALLALANTYKKSGSYSGPLYREARVQGNSIRIFFDNVGNGMKTTDGRPLTGFAIAGSDQKFVWANAEILGSCVIVSSPLVPDPVAVRYGWAMNPDCNLTNATGLPASPFRSDAWPRVP
ncbi:MAG: sialate O-acetylesterase [Fimbriimonas sp.]